MLVVCKGTNGSPAAGSHDLVAELSAGVKLKASPKLRKSMYRCKLPVVFISFCNSIVALLITR